MLKDPLFYFGFAAILVMLYIIIRCIISIEKDWNENSYKHESPGNRMQREIKEMGFEKWHEKWLIMDKAKQEWKEKREKEIEHAEHMEKLAEYKAEHCVYCGSRISNQNYNCRQCGAPAGN